MYHIEMKLNAIQITNEMTYSSIFTQSCNNIDMRYIKQKEYENMLVTVTKPKLQAGEIDCIEHCVNYQAKANIYHAGKKSYG